MLDHTAVYGWDLNGGKGFKDFAEARDTLDFDNIPRGSLWKVNGIVYRLDTLVHKPWWRKWEE